MLNQMAAPVVGEGLFSKSEGQEKRLGAGSEEGNHHDFVRMTVIACGILRVG